MFTAAVFTIGEKLKPPKCLSTDKWIKHKWHVYAMAYHTALKQEQNLSVCENMGDLEGITLSELSQTEKNKCHRISLVRI